MIIKINTFCFNFDLPKYDSENLKHKIEFIIKINKFLAENKIKTRLNNYKLWAWKQYSWTGEKKQMSHINSFLTCHEDKIWKVQINLLLFKTYPFITSGKI